MFNTEQLLHDAPVVPRQTFKKQPRPHIRVSAQNLAKARRRPWQRAHLAAGWVLGSVTIGRP